MNVHSKMTAEPDAQAVGLPAMSAVATRRARPDAALPLPSTEEQAESRASAHGVGDPNRCTDPAAHCRSESNALPAGASSSDRLVAAALWLTERGWVADALVRWGIRRLCAAGLRARARLGIEHVQEAERRLIASLAQGPVAVDTAAANQQHYELPPAFFELCLGRHLKYSGCWWPPDVRDLDGAEAAALELVGARAELADGQDVLELGCGWGSLTLWLAARYRGSRITAVSNSRPQREHILRQAAARGLTNVTVITADMNGFAPPGGLTFDRVVSIEMFEHMRNHAELLRRIATWLRPGGKLFVHIFAHRHQSYLYETHGPANWLGRYFFTGGIMPADGLLHRYQHDLLLEDHWRQDGTHYQRTADAWLANQDRHRAEIMAIFRTTYGPEQAEIWFNRWRVFFMACAEMFGYARGQEWWVAHYRYARRT